MVSTLRTMKTSITVAPNMPGVTLTDTASEAPEKSPLCGVEKLPEQAFRLRYLRSPGTGRQFMLTATEIDAVRGTQGGAEQRICGHRIAAVPEPTSIIRPCR